MTRSGFIYKIISKDESDTIVYYVGSTFDFKRRKFEHADCCRKNNNKQPFYSVLNSKGGWDNFNMVMVKEVKDLPDDIKVARPLLQRVERETMETMTAILNRSKPAPTEEEKKQKLHESYVRRHSEESPEVREQRLARQNEYNKTYKRPPLTAEQKARKLAVNALSRKARQQLTNERDREKRATETPEEREARLSKNKTDERKAYKAEWARKKREAKKTLEQN